jgi:hypothetical protein
MVMLARPGTLCLLLAIAGCTREHGADVVGDQCVPDPIPSAPGGERGFFSDQSYLQESSPSCEGHPCIVHRLDNGSDGGLPADPTNECEGDHAPPGCVTREALEQSVHCSCQCDGPGSRDNYCTCPNGFSCRQLIGLGIDDLTGTPGSFCVRPARAAFNSSPR